MSLIEKEPIMRFIQDGLSNKHYGHVGVEIITEVEYSPAIDAVPVVNARWIMNHFGAKCSNCLRLYCMEPSWSEKIKHMPPTWIYCPNCGARMDGDAE